MENEALKPKQTKMRAIWKGNWFEHCVKDSDTKTRIRQKEANCNEGNSQKYI